jgi:hypothetical protein
MRAAALLVICVALAGLLLGTWVWPLRGVIHGDLHGDSSLLTWNLWAMTEAVLHGQDPYRTSLLYSPVGANLAIHTYGLGFLPIGLLSRGLLGGEKAYPIVAYHVTIWTCFALGLFAAYHALRALGADVLAAVSGSMAWTFAPVFRSRALETHLVAAAFLLPTITLALAGFVKQPTRNRAALVGIAFGGCVYFSEYYSAFLWLAACLLAGVVWIRRDTRAEASRVLNALGTRGGAAGIAAFAIAITPFAAHWATSDALPLKSNQAYFESANLAAFVVPAVSASPLYRHVPPLPLLGALVQRGLGGETVFPGFPVWIFAGLGLIAGDGRLRRLLWALATIFLVLSLGPELKVFGTNTRVPLPYRALMQIPPFEMARAPARLAAIALWGLVCLMALSLTEVAAALAQRTSSRWPGTALALGVIAWSVAENHAPTPPVDLFVPPTELAELGPGGVLNVPVSARDSLAMLLQTLHGRPIATGYVSRLSRRQSEHVGHVDELVHGDSVSMVAGLQTLGIGNVIVARGATDADVERLRQTPLRVIDLRRLE